MWTHLNSVGCEVSPLALLEHVVGRVQPAMGLHLLQSGSLPVTKCNQWGRGPIQWNWNCQTFLEGPYSKINFVYGPNFCGEINYEYFYLLYHCKAFWEEMFPGVNYINNLLAPISYKSLCAAFFFLRLSFVIFWRKNNGEKAACKTLMKKLTTGNKVRRKK